MWWRVVWDFGKKYRKKQGDGDGDDWSELGDDEPVTMDDFYIDKCGEDFGMSAEFPPYIKV